MGDIFFGVILYVINIILVTEFIRPRTNSRGFSFSIFLIHYHILIGFYYGWFAKGTDTSFYWNLGDKFRQFNFESWLDTYGTHNYFVFFINYPFSKILGLDFWNGTFLYTNFSAWAFILLFLIGQDLLKTNVKIKGITIWPNVLLLPSFHFWSSGIGKDSLIFLFLTMFFYGIRDLRKYLTLVIISLILVYHVRPHIAFIVLLASAIMLIFDSKLHFSYKLIFFLLAIFGFNMIYDDVLKFLKIDELNTANIEGLFNVTSNNLSYGKSFIDMSGYPYPFKIFTFLYRPLFFDAHNISSFINSIENFLTLMLTIFIVSKVNPLKGYQKSPYSLKIMLLIFLLTTVAFSGALSNFGIMVRMKNMTFIYFIFFLVYVYDNYLYKKYLRHNAKITLNKLK